MKIPLSFHIHEKALALTEQRNTLLASNIANAQTPGYRSVDLDFREELSNFIHDPDLDVYKKAQAHKMNNPLNADHNDVNLEQSRIDFAKNSIDYMTSLTLISHDFSQLREVIRGE